MQSDEVAAADASARHSAAHGRLAPLEATVPAGPRAGADARALLTGWLAGRVSEGVLIDTRLLVTELVSNSLRHAELAPGAPLRIEANLGDSVLRLSVGDPGHAGAVARRAPSYQRSGGFGLHLVDILATRWGVDHARGTQVWLELSCGPPSR